MSNKRNESVYRKESLERLASPDQLDDYIRVQKPSVWIVLGVALALLAAAFIWAFTARLETTVSVYGIMDNTNPNNTVYCYPSESEGGNIAVGQAARLAYISEYSGTVSDVSGPYTYDYIAQDILAGNSFDIYMADIQEGNEYYQVVITGEDLPNGAFDVTIIEESVRPISFILN